jgi:TatD DNase family protein
MELFDTHSHYNDEKFNEDLEEIIRKTYDFGVTKFMCVGYNLESSKKAVQIAEKYDFIYATCGISPMDACKVDKEELKEIKKLSKHSKVLAIGEIGLDYYWEKDEEKRKLQQEFFIEQIKIANTLNKPIAIHTREAYIDTIKILKEYPCENTGIFHCCPLNAELIKDGLKLGYYISFSGVITFKNAKPEACVQLVPNDRLLIETDSPYLSPEPYRGTRNDSKNVVEVARKLSVLRKMPIEEIAKITYENACKVYKIIKM